MNYFFNNAELKAFRRQLRHDQTNAECILWSRIRRRQLCDLQFRRQFSIGPYIADFYCPSIRLVIELDGSQHLENHQYDINRDNFLKSRNIRVLRFWNVEVTTNLGGVIERIIQEITVNSTPSSSL